jgi:argonaute-like protein implicated in RNA metabolism and viral defense
MSSKEYAIELFERYFCELGRHFSGVGDDVARNCALMAVEEILEQFEDKCTDSRYYYFVDVKIELEKLYI